MIRPFVLVFSLVASALLSGCNGRNDAAAAGDPTSAKPVALPAAERAHPVSPGLTPVAQAGKQLFFDKGLSASKAMSCATCHDPDRAYGPPNDRAVQLGGAKGTSPGLRAVPSIRYKEFTPGYMDLLDNPDGVSTPAPGGGFAWDGRADSLAEQAKMPLLSPFEMANADPASVVAELRASPSATSFVRAFGARVFDDIATAFADVALALQSFQLEDPSFHPYTSKFDLHEQKKGEGAFTPAEERGFQVFIDPKKGNCAGCHFNGPGNQDGSSGMFTDYSYEAIGVPRNGEIPANRSAGYVDLGICGPVRKDHSAQDHSAQDHSAQDHSAQDAGINAFCGIFKTPTLRNTATRRAFFHNGAIHSLEQAVRFYNTRDTMPELWYPTVGGKAETNPGPAFPRYGLVTTRYAGGAVQKFDDLPAAHRGNIDRQMPLDGRAAGSEPPMTEQEVLDLICFLETLTDDYRPEPAPASGRCVK